MSALDTFEMLKQYPREAVEKALEVLGADPKADSFPTTIVEDVLGMIDGIDLAQQKVLAGKSEETQAAQEAPESQAIVVGEITSVAGDILHARNVTIDNKVLAVVAQAMVTGGRHEAEKLLKLREQSFVETFAQGNRQFETNVMQVVLKQQKDTEKMFSDENLQQMVNRGTVKHDNNGFDVNSFLSEFRAITQTQNAQEVERATNVQVLTETTEEFDVNAFLDEAWGEG